MSYFRDNIAEDFFAKQQPNRAGGGKMVGGGMTYQDQ